jgi:hypothetical protein
MTREARSLRSANKSFNPPGSPRNISRNGSYIQPGSGDDAPNRPRQLPSPLPIIAQKRANGLKPRKAAGYADPEVSPARPRDKARGKLSPIWAKYACQCLGGTSRLDSGPE